MSVGPWNPFHPTPAITLPNYWWLGGDPESLRGAAHQLDEVSATPTVVPPDFWYGPTAREVTDAGRAMNAEVRRYAQRSATVSRRLLEVAEVYETSQENLSRQFSSLAGSVPVTVSPGGTTVSVAVPVGSGNALVDAVRDALRDRHTYQRAVAQLRTGAMTDAPDALSTPGRPVLTGTDGPDDFQVYADHGRGVVEVHHTVYPSGERTTDGGHVERYEFPMGTQPVIRTGGGEDTVYVGPGFDGVDVDLGEGPDWLQTSSGGSYAGGAGEDVLELVAGVPAPTGLAGGAGDDRIVADSPATISGDDGADILFGSPGDDAIDGGTGDDTIIGWRGDDRLYGQDGNDHIRGGDGDDQVRGDGGDDYLDGGAGPDEVHGDDGDDIVSGGYGFDQISGGAGSDVMIGGRGGDTVDGGDGRDRVYTDGIDQVSAVEQGQTVDPSRKGVSVEVAGSDVRLVQAASDDLELLRNVPAGNDLLDRIDEQAAGLAAAGRSETVPVTVSVVESRSLMVESEDENPKWWGVNQGLLDRTATTPNPVVLFHELSHVEQHMRAYASGSEVDTGSYLGADPTDQGIRRDERVTVGLPVDMPDGTEQVDPNAVPENRLRAELGLPPRTSYMAPPP